jgi:hypothetical protein
MPDDQADVAIKAPEPEPETTQLVFELPEYHGRKPIGMKTNLVGTGNRSTREHTVGDRVVFVVEAKVKRAGGFDEVDDGLLYLETYKVQDMWEVVDFDVAQRYLQECRTAYREADKARTGQLDIDDVEPPDLPPAVDVDEFGVAILDAEKREAAGLPPLPAEDDDVVDAEIVDDEWEYDTPPPEVDERTAEQIAADAKADADAVAELEAGRRTNRSPIADYESLPARAVIAHVLEADEREHVLHVAAYEEAHRNRSTIVDAAMKRAADLVDA